VTSAGPDALSPQGTAAKVVPANAAMAKAVLRRPDLWWAALGALGRLAAPGWWRSPPHLPLPDRRLWAFRMVTAYGSPDASPEPSDVISYLEWCRSTDRRGRTGGRAGSTGSSPSRLDATHSG
jgi:hypothetical protein